MTRFPVLVADPPWRFRDRLRMSAVKRGADANYRGTLTIEDLCALPVGDLADDDAVLVLWRPSSFAREALRVMDAWGFVQKQEIVWYKRRQSGSVGFGMGRLFRAAKEVAYVGVRGRPLRLNRSIRDVFEAPPLPHSAKPEAVQDAIGRMFAGPYLELFARRQRPGWTCWGNEAPATLGRDIRDVFAERRAA